MSEASTLYRLALYSELMRPEAAEMDRRLMALIGKPHPAIGYIPSSADPARKYFLPAQAYFAALDATIELYCEIDEDYDERRVRALWDCDAIFLSGGNTYHFLYWLQARGLLQPLREYAGRGVLIGVSAGAILMTPDIATTALCGDVPREPISDLKALGLVNFAFLPHLNDLAAPEATLQAYAQEHQRVVYGCRDGDGIIVCGEAIDCVGEVSKVSPYFVAE